MNTPNAPNRGAELLRKVASIRKIAERLKLSPAQVHAWLQGKEPTEDRKAQIEAAWRSVYRGSWREPAGDPPVPLPAAPPAPPPPVPPAPPRPAPVSAPPPPPLERTEINVLAEAEAQVARLRAQIEAAQRDDIGASARAALERELRMALAQFAELRGELSPSDEERLLESDAWARIQAHVIDVVRALPERCMRREVAAALAGAFKILDPVLSAPA